MSENPVSARAGEWQVRGRTIHFGSVPLLMGIVNVTPDSFSDGGEHSTTDAALRHALQLVADGADIVDIGGESTRPYSEPVDPAEELRRVIPVVQAVSASSDVLISIDTSKPIVAEEALAAGAHIVNDVTGFSDTRMVEIATGSDCGICAMHMQGTPRTMQDAPAYEHVVEEVLGYLQRRKRELVDAGIVAGRICLDPGIGFGKTHQHNLDLIRNASRFHETAAPVLIGHSRKGFIGKLAGSGIRERDAGTFGFSMHLALSGIQILRLHEIRDTRAALTTLMTARPKTLPFAYPWPRPAMATDIAVFRNGPTGREVLLIRRRDEPFAGRWALPGGFVDPNETVLAAAIRELGEETGVTVDNLTLVGEWSRPDRDPRTRVISLVFRGHVPGDTQATANDDAERAEWFSVNDLPELAFDHDEMVAKAIQ